MKSESYYSLSGQDKKYALVALLGCAGSLIPLPLYFLGWWPMSMSVPFIVVPSILLMVGLAVLARRANVPTFWARYGAGFLGGLLATVFYDGSRLFGLFVNFPGFGVIHKFGQLITGIEELTVLTVSLGWLYHFMNGGVFGICYALVAGPRGNIWWGILWGLFLELGMFVTYPDAFGVMMSWGTAALTFSIIGHVFYGGVLGWYCQKKLTPSEEILNDSTES